MENNTFAYLVVGTKKKQSGQIAQSHAIASTKEIAIAIFTDIAERYINKFNEENEMCIENSQITNEKIKMCLTEKTNTIENTQETPIGILDKKFALAVTTAPDEIYAIKFRIWKKGEANTNSYEIRIIKCPIINNI